MNILARRTGTISVATLVGIVVAVCAAHAVAPETTRAAGLDVWNYGSAEAELGRADGRRDELEDAHDRLRRQIAAGEHVTAELVAGRLTLSAAVDEVEAFNRDRVGFETTLRTIYPAAPTHRTRVTEYLLAKAGRQAAESPGRSRKGVARGTAEHLAAARPAP